MCKQVVETKEQTIKKLMQINPILKAVRKNGKEKALSLEELEAMLHKISIRYGYVINSISPRYELVCNESGDIPASFVFYVASVTRNKRPVKWIGQIHGATLWELTANMILAICEDVRKERNKNDE